MQRVEAVLKSSLNGKNTFNATKTYAIAVLMYTFDVKCPVTTGEFTRRLLTKHRAHHPTSAVKWLILPRSRGGCGLLDIPWIYQRQMNSLRNYFLAQASLLHRVIVKADNRFTPRDFCHAIVDLEAGTSTLQQWTERLLHGRHAHDLDYPHTDREASYAW